MVESFCSDVVADCLREELVFHLIIDIEHSMYERPLRHIRRRQNVVDGSTNAGTRARKLPFGRDALLLPR